MAKVKSYQVDINHDTMSPEELDDVVSGDSTIAEGIQIHLMDRLLLTGATVEVRETGTDGTVSGLQPIDFGDFIG